MNALIVVILAMGYGEARTEILAQTVTEMELSSEEMLASAPDEVLMRDSLINYIVIDEGDEFLPDVWAELISFIIEEN